MSERIRVMVVEDHAVVRQGLIALLSSVPDIEVAGSVSDGAEAVSTFAHLNPDVTLMDLQLPRMGGVEAITRIRASSPAARFIVLTTFDGDEDIFRAMQAGAKAYLLKGMDLDELVTTIRSVHAGKGRIPYAVAEKLAERVSGQQLTARELGTLGAYRRRPLEQGNRLRPQHLRGHRQVARQQPPRQARRRGPHPGRYNGLAARLCAAPLSHPGSL